MNKEAPGENQKKKGYERSGIDIKRNTRERQRWTIKSFFFFFLAYFSQLLFFGTVHTVHCLVIYLFFVVFLIVFLRYC
jgi:Flp pilus assembly protein TadB